MEHYNTTLTIGLITALIILAVIQFGFFIWGIIELINANKKIKNQTLTLSDVKRVSISLPLGLGVLGIILLYAVVRPAIKNDTVASKKLHLFCWVPVIILNIIAAVIFSFSILTFKDLETTTTKDDKISVHQPEDKYNKQQSTSQNQERTKKVKKLVSEEGGFAIEMPCKNPIKQENSYICADTENRTFSMFGYQDVDGNLSDLDELSEKEFFEQFLTGFNATTNNTLDVDNFSTTNFKGMRAFKLSFKRSDGVEGKSIFGLSQKDNNTVRMYIIVSLWSKNNPMNEKFESFANSFEKL